MKRFILMILISLSLIFPLTGYAGDGWDRPTARFWTGMSAAPTTSDDASKGYRDRDFWESGNSLWVCTDNTAGAANWFQVVGTASGNSVYLLTLNTPLANFTASGNTLSGTGTAGSGITLYAPSSFNNPNIRIIGTNASDIMGFASLDNVDALRIRIASGSVPTIMSSLDSSSGGLAFNTVNANAFLNFSIGDATVLRAERSGGIRLGINTATPNTNTALDVQGQGSFSNGVSVGGTPLSGLTQFFVMGNGVSPAGSMTNGVIFYSTSGEAWVNDSFGTHTQLSSFDSITGEAYTKKHNVYTGRGVKIFHESKKVEEYTVPKINPEDLHRQEWVKNYLSGNVKEVLIPENDAFEDVEIDVEEEISIGDKPVYSLEGRQVKMRMEPIKGKVKSKKIQTKLKDGVRLNSDTGQFIKTVKPTLEDAEKAAKTGFTFNWRKEMPPFVCEAWRK